MMIGIALAALAVAPPGAPPGKGTRLWTEVGITRFSGSFEGSRNDLVGKTGVEGIGARIRSGLGFPIGTGFFLGPSVGLDYAFTGTSGGICCGTIERAIGARAGVEAALYPSTQIGFRISGGFGLATLTLLADREGRERNGPLAGVSAYGSYWTLAIARDYHVGARTRIGGVLRVESDSVFGRNEDHVFHMRTLTPSFSLVVLSHFAG